MARREARNPMGAWELTYDSSGERPRSLQHRAVKVPIGRYFLVIGSILFGMLFIADWYWPAATSSTFAEARFDRSIIRVQSAHRWPERIVFDTNLPTIVPPPAPAMAEAPTIAKPPRETFAQVNASTLKVTENTSPIRTKRKYVRHASTTRVAAYGPREALPAGW